MDRATGTVELPVHRESVTHMTKRRSSNRSERLAS